MRAIDGFLAYLQRAGINHVFGVPGGLLHPFFEAVEQDPEFTLVVAKHEEGAAFMADGFARVSGKIAICAGTSGPGATNLLTGLAVAQVDGVPMLVITGQARSTSLGRGAAQETPREGIDIVGMCAPVTKLSTSVMNPEELLPKLRAALRLVCLGRPGPVHLNVPVDFWEAEIEVDPRTLDPALYSFNSRVVDRDAARRAAEALRTASHPALLIGSGAASPEARAHLATLSELLRAPVATTPRGKGLFSETHPRSLGVFGFAGSLKARRLLLGDEVDVLCCVGASLNEITTFNWISTLAPRRALIHIDIDPERISRSYPTQIPVVGDAAATLEAIIEALRDAGASGQDLASTWPSRVDAVDLSSCSLACSPTENLLNPAQWRLELNQILPADAVVFSDIGGHMLFNIHHLIIRDQQRFVLNLGFGSMGHGTVAPIGAALALGGRPVVAIIGDACFTMNGMELLTAREYDVPVIWLIENNQMHGVTWHGSQLVGSRTPMNSVRYRQTLDIAAMCRAMGLATWRVRAPGELGAAMSEALAAGGPAAIEVCVDPSVSPPLRDRAQTIAGFSE